MRAIPANRVFDSDRSAPIRIPGIAALDVGDPWYAENTQIGEVDPDYDELVLLPSSLKVAEGPAPALQRARPQQRRERRGAHRRRVHPSGQWPGCRRTEPPSKRSPLSEFAPMEWTGRDLTAVGGLAIAAGGLAFAAFTVWLNHRRHQHGLSESYRAALYAAQLNAATEILRAAGAFHHEALSITREREPGRPDFGRSVAERLDAATAAVDLARSAGEAILPPGISDAVIEDVRVVFEAIYSSADPGEARERRRDRIQEAWQSLVGAVRRELAAKDLGEQVHRLTGVTAAKQLEPIIAEVRRVEESIERGEQGSRRQQHRQQ
jgi:hypothetical protein